MLAAARTLFGVGVVASLLGCSEPRDPVLNSMEQAVRAQLGSASRPVVGYIGDSTRLLIDFSAAALPDSQAATFERTARSAALAAVRRYPKAASLKSVQVSAGEPIGSRSLRVLRQRIFTAAELQ
jgi:hypothetical protein